MVRKLVSLTAKRQNKKGKYLVWTSENHAIQLYSNEVNQKKVQYIHMNPVRSRLTESGDYIYSIVSNYVGENGLLSIIQVDRILKTYH